MNKFKYNRDKRTWRLTLMWLVLIAAALIVPYFFSEGNYLNAWVISVVVAVLALFILSIPSRILIDSHVLEIRCLVETTRIEIRDIASVRKVSKKDYKALYPVVGGYGFFGYYGYYFDFINLEMVKVYATELNNFVEIQDIYEQRYLVSCRKADELIEAIAQAKLNQR